MKNDGLLIIATPTVNKIFDILYRSNKENLTKIYGEHFNSFLGRKPTPARLINAMTHINYGHKFLFDYETLKDIALSNGFKKFEKTSSENIENKEIKEFLDTKDTNYIIQTEIFIAYKQG